MGALIKNGINYSGLSIDMIYPVGSIYISVNNTNPGTYLTGTTWVAWGAGRVPVGVDTTQAEFNTVEKNGGGKTHYHWQTCGSDANVLYDLGDTAAPNTRVITNLRGTYSKTTPMSTGTMRQSSTYSESSLQPYITCYMWKRVS